MEVAMNDILAPCAPLATCPAEIKGRRRYSLSALRSFFAERRKQAYFRFELKRMVTDNPHLIDDIGLTKKEVEAEIAKLPFWQR
ncbi:DUF1127 domain-containing protein [Mesorhizobium sp. RIZ17]|jgi:uncharacterized protein YjiS (DUF1127 family)